MFNAGSGRSHISISAIAAGVVTAALLPAGFARADGATQIRAAHISSAQASSAQAPYQNSSLPTSRRVADLLGRMTLAEKVGQMTQAERGDVAADPSLVTTWGLGSVLSGGGSVPADNTPAGWADMVDGLQSAALETRLGIPLLYGVDSVHGHGNLLGATVFPHNIGLGATRDPDLVEAIGHVTAIETRASGPQWSFSPCVCGPRRPVGPDLRELRRGPGAGEVAGDGDRRAAGSARTSRRP
jgi:beta-glucosidase